MSYEKLGFEKGQVLKAEHLNHIEDGIANIISHYGEPIPTIEIAYTEYVDGDATFHPVGAPEEVFFYKISDLVPSVDDILGLSFIENGLEKNIPVTDDMFYIRYNCYMFDLFLVIQDNNKFELDGLECTAPSTGIYMQNDSFDPNFLCKMIVSTEPKIHKDRLPKLTTKFYSFHKSAFDGLYKSPRPSNSEEYRINSQDLLKAIDEGGMVIFKLWEDGDFHSIEYPYKILPGDIDGYKIYTHEDEYCTSDYKTNPV